MLLTGYTKNIMLPACMPGSTSLHCLANLNDDIGEVIPYINATLGGSSFVKEPPSVTFMMYGKLITVYAKQININALKDEEEADSILKWLQKEINEAWTNRADITPKYEAPPKPETLKVLKFLPKTNCKECGLPTCMVFATRVVSGLKDANGCPPLALNQKEGLMQYLAAFTFEE